MATNIPPHNMSEVLRATLAMIDNPDISLQELMAYIPGPDFPTAAIINGKAGIVQAYKTGRGRIYIRARTEIEENEKTNKSTIVVHELPYQVNKARLLEKIAELVRDKRIEGITGLRDESDKKGMRMVIELRRGEQADVILNKLYSMTQLQTVFGINMVALDKGQPRLVNLPQMLSAFLQHRREVVTRRTVYELRKSRERTHLLEGLTVALENVDSIIALIKASKTPADARDALLARVWPQGSVTDLLKRAAGQTRPDNLDPEYGLKTEGYHFSPDQVQAILDMKLHRLTGLETDRLREEYMALIQFIADLLMILSNADRLHEVIRQELQEILDQFGDARRTEILDSTIDMQMEDLINEEEVVLTLSQAGYVKSQTLDSYSAQHRGGRGKMATSVRDKDFVKNLLVANTHRQILCFSSYGKVYWMKAYQIPQASRVSQGRPIVNLLPLEKDESITAILPVAEFDENHFVFMATEQGIVKKVPLKEFERQRSNGKIALELNEGDHLIGVAITDGQRDVMLVSDAGKVIRFAENDVRVMGRAARGVRGIRLLRDQKLISLIIPDPDSYVLTATSNGYGQRTRLGDYRSIGRGGQGVIAIQVNERNGRLVSATQVTEKDEVLLISDQGTMVRTRVAEIPVMGRNTQGVRLIQVVKGEHIVGMEAIPAELIREE
jgi:DNA gyrase subunit A